MAWLVDPLQRHPESSRCVGRHRPAGFCSRVRRCSSRSRGSTEVPPEMRSQSARALRDVAKRRPRQALPSVRRTVLRPSLAGLVPGRAISDGENSPRHAERRLPRRSVRQHHVAGDGGAPLATAGLCGPCRRQCVRWFSRGFDRHLRSETYCRLHAAVVGFSPTFQTQLGFWTPAGHTVASSPQAALRAPGST